MATLGKKLKSIDPAQIRSALQPLANQLPGSMPVVAEVQPLPALSPIPTTAEDIAAEIARLWSTAQETFLDIGRLLDQAQRTLPLESYARLCDGLPFGKSARSQLLTAYRLIGSGALPVGSERAGYATLYLCATLTEQERSQAIAEGVIQPDMLKRDIVAFRKRIRAIVPRVSRNSPPVAVPDSIAEKRVELERLKVQKSWIENRIRELEGELA